MYGAMHLKSTSATPILIVLSVTPWPISVESGVLFAVDPNVTLVVFVVPVLVPLPHAASTSAIARSSAPIPVRRAFTSFPLARVGRTLRVRQRWCTRHEYVVRPPIVRRHIAPPSHGQGT